MNFIDATRMIEATARALNPDARVVEIINLHQMLAAANEEKVHWQQMVESHGQLNRGLTQQVERMQEEIDRLKRALAKAERLVDEFEPKARSACHNPPEGCACEGCAYHRELTKEEP